MAEWLFEQGIGESRAVLVDDGHIVEAAIERDGGGIRAGAVVPARLAKILVPKRRGIVMLASGGEALMEPLPSDLAEGAAFNALVMREAIPERGRPKLPRVAWTDAPARPAPLLRDRIAATGIGVGVPASHEPDALEAAGWSELLEEAVHGDIGFTGGALRISLTPAMTLIDVDGDLPPAALACAGAAAAGRAIRRLDITGSIGIDLPTLAGKADRAAAAASLDAALPQQFERTAVNGFGFMQIIRRRVRPSLPEMLQADPVLAAALALLRRAERTAGAGVLTLTAHPAVIARIEAQPGWMEELRRRTAAQLRLLGAEDRPISAGDASREHP